MYHKKTLKYAPFSDKTAPGALWAGWVATTMGGKKNLGNGLSNEGSPTHLPPAGGHQQSFKVLEIFTKKKLCPIGAPETKSTLYHASILSVPYIGSVELRKFLSSESTVPRSPCTFL